MTISLKYLSYLFHKVRNLIFKIISPPYCAYCKVFLINREPFCGSCNMKLQRLPTIMVPIMGTKEVKLFAAAAYREPIKSLVVAKSWSDYMASKHLGELIWQLTDIKHQQFDYIIPIPLHWMRYARRGYNQAEEIAKVIAQKSNKPIIHGLKRIKRTQFQSALPSENRMSNVACAFKVVPKYKEIIMKKNILLIDDLMTTGATLQAAGKELYQLKPASIIIAVACRIIK